MLQVDSDWLVLIAAAVDDKNFCWLAGCFVAHGVGYVAGDESGFAYADAVGSSSLDLKRQFAFQSKYKFLRSRMHMPS